VAANCSGGGKLTSKIDPKYGVSASPRVVKLGDPVPKGGGAYRVGKPYVVAGRTYVPAEPDSYKKDGLASWYGEDFHGRLTANGEVFDMNSIAAAHPTLPLPSYVRVTNLTNGRSMKVRVNDRGPFHENRLIDVSERTASMLGFKNNGTARVRVEYLGRAALEGSDDIQLAATLREKGQPAPSVMVASAGNVPLRAAPVSAGVPLPPGRPFDLGDQVASAAPALIQSAPQAPDVASAPRQAAARAVAVAPRPAVAAKPRPVRVTDAASRAVVPPAPAAPSGWVVGPQPAMGYAPTEIVTPVGTGRGLY